MTRDKLKKTVKEKKMTKMTNAKKEGRLREKKIVREKKYKPSTYKRIRDEVTEIILREGRRKKKRKKKGNSSEEAFRRWPRCLVVPLLINRA